MTYRWWLSMLKSLLSRKNFLSMREEWSDKNLELFTKPRGFSGGFWLVQWVIAWRNNSYPPTLEPQMCCHHILISEPPRHHDDWQCRGKFKGWQDSVCHKISINWWSYDPTYSLWLWGIGMHQYGVSSFSSINMSRMERRCWKNTYLFKSTSTIMYENNIQIQR